jgi:hypothetical protein
MVGYGFEMIVGWANWSKYSTGFDFRYAASATKVNLYRLSREAPSNPETSVIRGK